MTRVIPAALSPSAHQDDFARAHLPPPEQWPDFHFDLPALQYPARLNCVAELLDKAVARGGGERIAIYGEHETLTYAQLHAARRPHRPRAAARPRPGQRQPRAAARRQQSR